MKKLFAALTVVAYLFISSSAMAAGYKAPKEICLQASPGAIFCLASKSFGSVVLEENNKLQYYLIAGSFYQNGMHHPLNGSGYMDSSVFRFHISVPHICTSGSDHVFSTQPIKKASKIFVRMLI